MQQRIQSTNLPSRYLHRIMVIKAGEYAGYWGKVIEHDLPANEITIAVMLSATRVVWVSLPPHHAKIVYDAD